MRLELETIGEVAVARLEGRVDANSSRDLGDALDPLARNGDGDLVLDFSDVDYISSAGLRVLLAAYRALSGQDRALILAACNPDVLDVITLTGFDKILKLAPSVDAALVRGG